MQPQIALPRGGPGGGGSWWLLPAGVLLLVALLGVWLLQDQVVREARGRTREAMAARLEAMAQCQAFASRYVVERTPDTRARFVRPHRQPDEVVENRVSDRGGGTFVVRDAVTLATSLAVERQEYSCVVTRRGGSVWRVETFELSGE